MARTKNEFDRLAKRMQRGDAGAAEELYGLLAEKVFGFCMNRTRDRGRAEDIAQDIFLKLVAKIDLYDPARGGFLVWFWQLARNTVIDSYRGERGTTAFADMAVQPEEEAWDPVEGAQDPAEQLDLRMERERLERILEKCTQEEQDLFRLRFLAELPYSEIATILGKPPGTLRVAAARLRRKVREEFSNHDHA